MVDKRALAALPEVPGSIPSTHLMVQNHLQLPGTLMSFSGLCRHQACMWDTDTSMGKTLVYIKKKKVPSALLKDLSFVLSTHIGSQLPAVPALVLQGIYYL